jgi:hypothetical protein
VKGRAGQPPSFKLPDDGYGRRKPKNPDVMTL